FINHILIKSQKFFSFFRIFFKIVLVLFKCPPPPLGPTRPPPPHLLAEHAQRGRGASAGNPMVASFPCSIPLGAKHEQPPHRWEHGMDAWSKENYFFFYLPPN